MGAIAHAFPVGRTAVRPQVIITAAIGVYRCMISAWHARPGLSFIHTMFTPEARSWLARSAGTDAPFELIPLKGATSSSIYLIRAEDQPHPFVLRVLDNARWLAGGGAGPGSARGGGAGGSAAGRAEGVAAGGVCRRGRFWRASGVDDVCRRGVELRPEDFES